MEVTHEMVGRALRAFYKHTAVQNFPQVSYDQMSHALEAAFNMITTDQGVLKDDSGPAGKQETE